MYKKKKQLNFIPYYDIQIIQLFRNGFKRKVFQNPN